MDVELWPNNMGLKMKCYWECFKEHIRDLGNILGT
jgi:hypothetical protein